MSHAIRYVCNLIRNHLKRRSFLVASSSPPWLNLYFCCSATKIKEKYNVQSADLHGSKSVRITPRLPAIFYPLPTHFHFLKKMKIYQIPLAEYFIREAYFTFSQKRKYFTFCKAEYIGASRPTSRL